MNSIIRLFTLLSAGVVLGSMAGRMARMEKINISRLLGVSSEDENRRYNGGDRFSQPKPDETEECFI